MSYQINAFGPVCRRGGGGGGGGGNKILWNKLFVYIHMVKGYSDGLWI